MTRRPRARRKGRGGSWLPEPATRKEAPALRDRLIAAVARGLAPIWRWLQDSRLGRLVAYYIPRRGVGLHPWAASCYLRGVELPAVEANPGAAIRITAILYQPLVKKKNHKAQEEAHASTAWKPHIVDNIEVPLDQELLYEEYYRRALKNVQGKSSLCHMCIFEGQRTSNGIVPNGGMIVHCRNYHDEAGIECEEEECQVRFRENKHRERRLHQYFFHQLPEGWWPKRR